MGRIQREKTLDCCKICKVIEENQTSEKLHCLFASYKDSREAYFRLQEKETAKNQTN